MQRKGLQGKLIQVKVYRLYRYTVIHKSTGIEVYMYTGVGYIGIRVYRYTGIKV